MSQIAFVTWNGGGNLGPALAIARELRRRGPRAAFLGQETQRPAIEAVGHTFIGCTLTRNVGSTVLVEHPQATPDGMRTTLTRIMVSGIHPGPMRGLAYLSSSGASIFGCGAWTSPQPCAWSNNSRSSGSLPLHVPWHVAGHGEHQPHHLVTGIRRGAEHARAPALDHRDAVLAAMLRG